jgi:phosphoglycolate phosphatase
MTTSSTSSPTIVFDLDGTLVDTAPDLVDTLNVIFTREGLPAIPYDYARLMIGGGAQAMIERGLKAVARSCTPEVMERLFSDFLDHYAAHIADRSRPFPGLHQALDRMAARGCRFAVCTNKLEWLSVRLLDALGLSSRFEAVCGQDTFGIQKPDARVLRQTIERAGGSLDCAVMIGDSATDVRTARNAGIPVVAVSFGYTETPIELTTPDRLIDHFDDLPDAVFDLLSQRPATLHSRAP